MKQSTWNSFIALCLKAKTSDELSELLNFFLTAEEKASISDRYAIIEGLLKSKETQRELASSLNVSIAKITRGSNALKTIPLKLKAFFHKNIV